MSDVNKIVVSGRSFDEFSKSLTKAIQALPQEMSERLRDMRRDYFAWYGFEGMYERMNNRSVGQILAEFRSVDRKPIAAGQIDGLSFRLDEAGSPSAPEQGERTED
jgi:hypothetical protein